MASFIKRIGNRSKKRIKSIIDSVYRLLPLYRKHLYQISIADWFEISKGNLYKINKFGIRYTPRFFGKIFVDMTFEIPKLDLELLRKQADLAFMRSMVARTGNKSLKFEADSLENQIRIAENKRQESKSQTLDDFIDFIELTFNNIGALEPKKLKANRAYSLYFKAIDKNKAIEKHHKKLKNVHSKK